MEKPILFSGDMVRAILDGRKTQTRRVIKLKSKEEIEHFHKDFDGLFIPLPLTKKGGGPIGDPVACPFGKPGDRLWVRETFTESQKGGYLYKADGTNEQQGVWWGWKPSIHMPRWASRITLEITEVRVERLREISEEDAEEEGVNAHCDECGEVFDIEKNCLGYCWRPDCTASENFTSRKGFELLWDSINVKKHPWDSNPWVWVISFKKVGA